DASFLLSPEERQNPESEASLRFHRRLSELLQTEPAIGRMDRGSSYNLLVDAQRSDVLVQVRFSEDRHPEDTLIVVQNWGRHDFMGAGSYRIPVPEGGEWEILVNSDASEYGGKNHTIKVGTAQAPGIFGTPFGLNVELPRYTTLVLKKVQSKASPPTP